MLSALPGTPQGVAVPVLLVLAVLALPPVPGRSRWRALTGAGRGRPAAGRLTVPLPLLAAPLGGLLLGPVGAVCAAGVAWGVRRRLAARRAADRAGATAAELADALARVTDELRTGAHPAAALAGHVHDGPLARALLEPAAVAARIGEPVPEALRRAARGPARRDIDRIAAAWELADTHGAPLADLLTGLLDDIRWRIAHGARVRAQLAGPRATASVLTALPLAGIGLGQLMGIAPLTVLRTGLHGPALLLTGVVLTVAGAVWADRILRGAVPG
ncbi:type II secretion system F family protein [Pseudonocardia sp. ICBG1293]|uniref:type II secretion system F family protein n=1 Tax=Pseudonocardia sp. ICBG1293 TaxID=2844382 RepID=UPI001CCCE4B0|nr:type II secretion system F family protein [Pseudonocardia sp. ICBG1293]